MCGDLLKDLYVAVVAVERVKAFVWPQCERVDAAELVRFFTSLAKLGTVAAIGIAHNDSCISQAVGDQKFTVWQERDVLRLCVMGFVFASDVFLT